ncbi:hypothetical protein MKX03_022155 [Papaver bracteatum]|nr:hypothetical protein MKX03_022155 [Papaver bracteatum]
MSSYYYSHPSGPSEVEIRICSAQDLKNITWKHGPLQPYAVVWSDPSSKVTTKVDEYGDTCPNWDDKLTIPLSPPVINDDSYLYIDIVHSKSADDDVKKPLIGSIRVSLKEIVDEVGMGEWAHRKLNLKRPSGRPHGKLEVEIKVPESRHRAPDSYYAPPANTRYYSPVGSYPYSSGGDPHPYDQQPYGQNPAPYGQPNYGQPAYGQPAYGGEQHYGGGSPKREKDSKFGLGTGLAVGAVAGVLGGIAISEGIDHWEESIADDVEERLEEENSGDYDDE